MKYAASIVAGAAVASAAAVRSEPAIDYCPVVVKTIGLSWIDLTEFKPAHTQALEEAKAAIESSKPQPQYVYNNITVTATNVITQDSYPTGSGYPTGHMSGTYSASVAAPYPTGLSNFTGNYPVPTGGVYSTKTASAASEESDSAGRSSSSTSSAAAQSTGSTCTNPRVRVEWSNMSDSDRDSYVAAISCLLKKPSADTSKYPGSRNRYEDLSSLHQQVAGQVHQSGKFLVFHRFYLYMFEYLLRNECGMTTPFPWWDEANWAGKFADSDLFTERWLGTIPEAVNGRGVCIQDTGFGSYEPNLGPDSAVNNPHCLSRALDESTTAKCGSSYVDNCRNAQNYDAYRQCVEFTYHAYGHNGVGSVMSNVATSPEDPFFFSHHAAIDREYRYWQNRGADRDNEMGGPMSSSDNTQVTPSDILPALGIVADVAIADVMSTENGYLCYKYDSE